jgi:hypothetical protein
MPNLRVITVFAFLTVLICLHSAPGHDPALMTSAAAPRREATTAPAIERQCQALLERWKDRLDAERMTVVISPPFVVAGDGGPARVERYVAHTIRAASECLRKQFFDRPLDEPVLILLFESAEPYNRLAKEWLGDTDISPYGYFRRDGVMVMNVGTGTGTLVHELVHALIKPDFPDVPDWLNEGLGSLFEQCTLAGGSIRGLENWRLPALQRAIRADRLRPLPELIEDPRFYTEASVGLNYAQARYLLMYLQEKGLLERYYKRLRPRAADDPTGLKTLREIIEPQTMEQFEKAWREWVLQLRFE